MGAYFATMQYKTTKETAERWGCSDRWVQELCKAGRVKDAKKVGRDWLVPPDAKQPKEPRGRRWVKP